MPEEHVVEETSAASEKRVGVRLLDFQTLEFCQYEISAPAEEVEELKYEFGTELGFDDEQERILARMSATAFLEVEGERINVGRIVTATTFEIDGFEAFHQDEGELTIPDVVIVTLVNVAFATTRGAMVTRAERSLMNRHIMPLMNPRDLLKGISLQTGGSES